MNIFLGKCTFRYLSAITVTLLSMATAAQAAEVVAGPTGASFVIGRLPDGNYRFCSEKPDGEDAQAAGACFRFRKEAQNIIGTYYYPNKGSSICFRGKVNSNTFSGQAIERFSVGETPPENFSQAQLSSWETAGFLQVGNGLYVDDLNRRDAIVYRSALLNLNNFYQYNAGRISPPVSCPTRPSSLVSALPTPDELREVGTSDYYNQPIYLDFSSIEPVTPSTYLYTTLIGQPTRLSETEYQVDCQNLESIEVLRSRYYDQDGDLQELEIVNKTVPIDRSSPFATQRYNAVQVVCQEYAQIDIQLPTNDISYERYRNQRFSYSLLYPSDVLIPQSESTEVGQVFQSATGDIQMRVYGESNGSLETLRARYEQAQADRSSTYQTISDDFFVVSGTDDGKVFYQKTLLDGNVFKVLEIEYDQALSREFDTVARAIADSFASTVPDAGLSQLPESVQTAVLDLAAANTEAESAVFEITSVEAETWPNGCLGLQRPDELCTQALVSGWRVKVEANLPGGLIQFTYRTDETGDRIRFEN
ncbi:MAG: hypothetical protein WA949_05855 [Phormidesmis sp.]